MATTRTPPPQRPATQSPENPNCHQNPPPHQPTRLRPPLLNLKKHRCSKPPRSSSASPTTKKQRHQSLVQPPNHQPFLLNSPNTHHLLLTSSPPQKTAFRRPRLLSLPMSNPKRELTPRKLSLSSKRTPKPWLLAPVTLLLPRSL